jgi:hypothetical protein
MRRQQSDPAALRAALIRLLWRSVVDADVCDCGFPPNDDVAPACEAMRALGWGQHWNDEVFRRRAARIEFDGVRSLARKATR